MQYGLYHEQPADGGTMRTLILVVALFTGSPALSFVTGPELRVTSNGGTDFTVEYRSTARLTDYWCAAGRHVTLALGLPGRTRVFRQSPPPRKIGQGISFTLDPDRSAGVTGLSTYGGPQDGSMSASGAAAQFCFSFDIERF
jgi:hypothetical protein